MLSNTTTPAAQENEPAGSMKRSALDSECSAVFRWSFLAFLAVLGRRFVGRKRRSLLGGNRGGRFRGIGGSGRTGFTGRRGAGRGGSRLRRRRRSRVREGR